MDACRSNFHTLILNVHCPQTARGKFRNDCICILRKRASAGQVSDLLTVRPYLAYARTVQVWPKREQRVQRAPVFVMPFRSPYALCLPKL